MRLFFAIDITDELADRIMQVQQDLRRLMHCETIRWSRREQFHYTVKFLGEQPMPRAQKAVEAAERVCASARPFTLTLAGLGAFPTPSRPSVLWIGASSGSVEHEALARAMEEELARERFRRESRPPTAHLTIARIKTYDAEVAAADGLPRAQVGEIGSVSVDHLTLMSSVLRPAGSEYAVVQRFAMKGGETD